MKKISKIILSLVIAFTLVVPSFTTVNAATTNTEIANYARTLQGRAFQMGGLGPYAFDCGGLVYYVYHHFGLLDRHHCAEEYFYSPTKFGKVVSASNALPGDVIAWSGHVGIYLGDGLCISALNESDGVLITSVNALTDTNGSKYHIFIRMNGVSTNGEDVVSASLSKTKYVYDGKKKTPTVTVKNEKGKVLTKGTHYKVSYSSGRTLAGQYNVTIKGIGKYNFTVKKTFKILPEGTDITKLRSKRAAFDVHWDPQKVQTSGYQLRISKNSDFSTKVDFNFKKDQTKETIVQLRKNKRYHTKIRTYKNVNGVKVYSYWSDKKSVTTQA